MKKFLFILLLIPSITALGHDIYFYTENQDKGFRLSDLGKLWDTYHKESHDQWKIKIDEWGDAVQDVVGKVPPTETSEIARKTTPTEIQTDFNQGFSQEDNKQGKIDLPPPPKEKAIIQSNTKEVKNSIGFLLEQKAIFVFAAIPAIFFILNALLCLLFRERKGKEKQSSKPQKGKYTYGRK